MRSLPDSCCESPGDTLSFHSSTPENAPSPMAPPRCSSRLPHPCFAGLPVSQRDEYGTLRQSSASYTKSTIPEHREGRNRPNHPSVAYTCPYTPRRPGTQTALAPGNGSSRPNRTPAVAPASSYNFQREYSFHPTGSPDTSPGIPSYSYRRTTPESNWD